MRVIRTTHLGAFVGALVFAAAAFLGRLTTPDGQSFALVWPASGVLLVWLLVRGAGPRTLDLPAVAVAAYAVNLVTGAPPLLALVLAAVNVVQGLVHVVLLRRYAPAVGSRTPRLDSHADLVTLMWTAVVASLTATVVGAAGVVLATGSATEVVDLAVWWGRLLAGALVVGTAGILAFQHWLTDAERPGGRLRDRALETGALIVLTVIGFALTFTVELPLAFAILALTVWSAKRFSTLFTAWHALLCGCAAVVFTLAGQGPFSLVADDRLAALTVQGFVTLMSVLALFVAVSRDERASLLDSLARANRASQRQAQLLGSIVDSMQEGVIAVDDSGELLLQNPAAMRLLETDVAQTPDQLAHRGFLVDGEPMPAERRPSVRALAGEQVEEDVLLGRADGSTRQLVVSATPLPSITADEPARAVLVFRDVTAERQQRAELTAFAGVVAHDLNNPLTAIAGWNAMLLTTLEGEDCTKEQVQRLGLRVQSATQRLHELIEGLLERASSNDRALELAPVDLDDLLTRVVETRGIESHVKWHRLPAVRADKVLAGQLLDNLVGNAVKYVAPGVEPHVQVSARSERPGWVTVSVADNGIGIPDGEHEAVFDEFRRAHADGAYEGTGLGLSIVKRIVTRHDGRISAAPNPSGQGTVFEFTLPAA